MKKAITVCLALVLFALSCYGAEEFDFRKMRWDMTRKEIIASEMDVLGEPSYNKPDSLRYRLKLSGLSAQLIYVFHEETCYIAMYMFNESHVNENGYIDDYEKIKKILTEKYGEPDVNRVLWKNDLYKNKPSKHGFAVSIGHLWYGATWVFPNGSAIIHILSGENYKINHLLSYLSPEYDEIEKKKEEQEASSNF